MWSHCTRKTVMVLDTALSSKKIGMGGQQKRLTEDGKHHVPLKVPRRTTTSFRPFVWQSEFEERSKGANVGVPPKLGREVCRHSVLHLKDSRFLI